MKVPRSNHEETSATITQSLLLVAGLSVLCMATSLAVDPSWWQPSGAVLNLSQVTTNNGVVVTNNYIAVNQGQLKQFTARAVDELNAYLPGGAGTNLNNLVQGWSQDYATNNYSSTNNLSAPYKPSDYGVVNVGQLKQIGSLVWSQLVNQGYTNAMPSWLAGVDAGDYSAANIGQLKTVFNFDLSGPNATNNVTGLTATLNPDGSVTLNWSLPAGDGDDVTIEGEDANGNWDAIEALDPSTTSVTLDASQVDEFPLLSVSDAFFNSLSSLAAATVPNPAYVPPRYAVIDLGAGLNPGKITNSGYVLLFGSAQYPAVTDVDLSLDPQIYPYVNYQTFLSQNCGPLQPILPQNVGDAFLAVDVSETGEVIGWETTDDLTVPAIPLSTTYTAPSYTWYRKQLALWTLPSSPLLLSAPLIVYGGDFPISYNAGKAVNSSTYFSTQSVTAMGSTSYPVYPSAFLDGFNGLTEMGTAQLTPAAASGTLTGSFVQAMHANDTSLITYVQTYAGNASFGSGNDTWTTSYQLGPSNPPANGGSGTTTPVAFIPVSLSNTGSNLTGYVSATGTQYFWDGTPIDSPKVLPQPPGTTISVVAANSPTGSLTPTTVLGIASPPYQTAEPYIWQMNSTTHQFSTPEGLNALISSNSGWSLTYVRSINDYGAIVGTASHTSTGTADPIATGQHGVMLLPVQVTQSNYPVPSTTDTNTDSGAATGTQTIIGAGATNGIALITGAPAMPQLTAQIGGGGFAGSGMTVDWRAAVTSERPERGTKDNFDFPFGPGESENGGPGVVDNLPINQAWTMNDDFPPSPQEFFGGNITIYFTIRAANGTALGPEQSVKFKIRGLNPLDATAKTYLQGPACEYSWAWALAEHESRQTSSAGFDTVYNQFNSVEGVPELPNFSGGYPEQDGWGIFQRDDTHGGIYVATDQVYSWTVNTFVAMNELESKQATQQRFFSAVAAAYPNDPEAQTPPASYPAYPGSTTMLSALDMGTITLYNTAFGCPPSTLNGITYTNPWTFNENETPGKKWSYTQNINNYLYKVIYNEYEGRLPYSE